MGMTLRDYQRDSVESVWKHLREKDTNPCVVIPTAGGKSLCIAEVAREAVVNWGGRVIILAHVKELVEQNADKVQRLAQELKVGVYSAGLGRKDVKEPVIVAGIQSIYREADRFEPFDIVIIDEAHLIPTEGEGRYRAFLNAMKERNPNVRLIGFTATPYRTKGGVICKKENLLNEVCYEISVKELIRRGFISRLESKCGKVKPDLTRLHIRAGEFVQEDIDEAMDDEAVVSAACREIVDRTKDRKACLIFCTSVKHCKHVAELITKYSGEECPIVTGDTPSEERADTIARLRGETVERGLFKEKLGPLKYCCNVSVMTTGTDIPNLDTVVTLRPTASAGLFVQMVGRGFRLSPATGKRECLILDYGRNLERFGAIDTITVSDKTGEPGGVPVKECPKCQAAVPISIMTCPSCGFEFEKKEKESKLDSRASERALISPDVEEETYPVVRTTYDVWTKRGAPPTYPKTVKVTYVIDMMTSFSEWLCPEHEGYARKKFVKWWREHTDEGTPIPKDAADLCEFAFMGCIKNAEEITVRRVAGEKFPRIVKYKLGESDAAKNVAAMKVSGEWEDDLPF